MLRGRIRRNVLQIKCILKHLDGAKTEAKWGESFFFFSLLLASLSLNAIDGETRLLLLVIIKIGSLFCTEMPREK